MRYTLLLYSNEADFADMPPEAMQEQLAVFGAYIGALREAGVFVDTDWLQPSMSATTVSMKDGEALVQDGPFVDSKDQLGGYFVIDVDDLDAALDWAAKCPAAQYGTIEIRPSAMPDGQV